MFHLKNGLQPGDEVHCTCGQWHAVETGKLSEADHAYMRSMVYFTCNGQPYFAGTIGQPSRHQARRPVGPRSEP